LQDRLTTAQNESKTYYVKWMESDKQLREQTSRTQFALNELQALKSQKVSPDARVSGLEAKLQVLQKDLDQEKEQQRLTLAALEVAKKSAVRDATTHPQAPAPPSQDVAALQEKVIRLEAKVGNYEDRVTAAADELARLKRSNDDWAKKVQAAQDELAAAKALAARDFEQSQAAYLAAAAPTERGLKARQSASKRARLVQRVTALRRGDPPQAAVALLDRLEVVLTRLDMIDPSESRSTRGFVKLLDNGGLVQKIDAATTIPSATPELLSVLAEAKLVLAGAENVM
jgi:chromosome segregation ATPase